MSVSDQVDVTWDTACGAEVFTRHAGYIDFTSGIFVANVGHAHPEVCAAIETVGGSTPLHTYTFPNQPALDLCAKLTTLTGFEDVRLFTTGSEAVEAAVRAARAYTGRPDIVSWCHSMHGKTLGAQQLSSGGPFVHQHEWTNVPVNRWGELPFLSPLPMTAAAVIVETYHGWGARWYPKQYIQDVAQWCKDHGALLIFDEIQAGFGRTGKMFGYEWYDVEPDMIVIGKGMGGGMPISAVLGPKAVLEAAPDMHSTHSGNPVCCAAALATIDVIEREGLVERALEIGRIIAGTTLLPDHLKMIMDLRGRGAAWAIWLNEWPRFDEVAIRQANEIVELAATRGLLLLKTHCGTIKIGPPLMIPEAQLREGLDILTGCIKEVLG